MTFSNSDYFNLGWAVSGGTDINHDGIDDMVVSAWYAEPTSPSAVPSRSPTRDPTCNPSRKPTTRPSSPTRNPTIQPSAPTRVPSGQPTASLTDLDLASFIPGAASAVYVLYGTSGQLSVNSVLSLSPAQGYKILAPGPNDECGSSVAGIGNINNDGFADMLIGCSSGSPLGRAGAGVSYLLYGVGGSSLSNVDLSILPSNPSMGKAFYGGALGDYSGYCVSAAGDVNDDGVLDYYVGSPSADAAGKVNSGKVYLLYGPPSSAAPTVGPTGQPLLVPTFYPSCNPTRNPTMQPTGSSTDLDLASFIPGAASEFTSGSMGFRIGGPVAGTQLHKVGFGGRINSDGYDDLLVASPKENGNKGALYILYGHSNAINFVDVSLSPTEPAGNFTKIPGAVLFGQFGSSVSSAGDFNGDGLADIIIGGGTSANSVFILYGTNEVTSVNLTSIHPSRGFKIGGPAGFRCGSSVASVGDINHDGFADVLIGCWYASPLGRTGAGATYLLYGGPNFSNVDLSLLPSNPSAGRAIYGGEPGDNSGSSGAGKAYLIYGTPLSAKPTTAPTASSSPFQAPSVGPTAFSMDIDLQSFTSGAASGRVFLGGGFKILGATLPSDIGKIVLSGGGRLNNDRFDDLLVSFSYGDDSNEIFIIYGHSNTSVFTDVDTAATPTGTDFSKITGKSADSKFGSIVYVFYGTNDGVNVNLVDLTSAQGFRISGPAEGYQCGASVAGLGNINGDAYSDILIGCSYGSPLERNVAGVSYVIYGGPNLVDIDLSTLTPSEGFAIAGSDPEDYSGAVVARAGDVNRDGVSDYYISAYQADPVGKSDAGIVYLLYGPPPPSPTIVPSVAPIKSPSCAPTRIPTGKPSIPLTDTDLASFIPGAASGRIFASGIFGFRVVGAMDSGLLGRVVHFGGRINSDVYDDLLISAPSEGAQNGALYIIYGRSNATVFTDIDTGMGPSGFGYTKISGVVSAGQFGSAVTVGDLNGDGLNDIIVGNPGGGATTSMVYVLYGAGGAMDINLASLTPFASGLNRTRAGVSYLLYGGSDRVDIDLSLLSSNPSMGKTIYGGASEDLSGFCVAAAGDVNSDGGADSYISSYRADPLGRINAGKVHLFYGIPPSAMPSVAPTAVTSAPSVSAPTIDIDLSAFEQSTTSSEGRMFIGANFEDYIVAGVNGFRIVGKEPYSQLGSHMARGGDINELHDVRRII
eukprot:gene9232-10888_t